MTRAPERPLLESYWVLPGRLLAGEYPHPFEEDKMRRTLDAFLESGWDCFFDLTQEGELPSYQSMLQEQARVYGVDVSYQRFPILDRGLPTRSQMIATLNALDQAVDGGHRVYLHCWGGVGRTGITVGSYLVRHGLTGRQAFDQIAQWWQQVPKSRFYPRSPETDEQVQFILNWHE